MQPQHQAMGAKGTKPDGMGSSSSLGSSRSGQSAASNESRRHPQVTFSDIQNRVCVVRLGAGGKLDLMIDRKQKVQSIHSVWAEADKLYFVGLRRVFFNGEVSMKVPRGAREIVSKVLALKATAMESRAESLLRKGMVRILRAKWMLQQPEGYVLQRCQELPAEAFVPPATAAQLFKRDFGLVVLSYPWLSEQHPDPTGFHFAFFRQYLAKHMGYFGGSDSAHDDFGVFWDFAALPQHGQSSRRTPEERDLHRRGLGVMHFFYGSTETLVVQLKNLPESTGTGQDLNLRPYEERGWCMFEATVANILKSSFRLLDLSSEPVRESLAKEEVQWPEVQSAAAAERVPILDPDTMKAELEKTAFTNGKDDLLLVVDKYEEFFHLAAASTSHLRFSNWSMGKGWDDEAMARLSVALPAFVHAEDMYLGRHSFTDAGLGALLDQLPKLKHLTLLHAVDAKISGSCFSVLAGRQMPTMRRLQLSRSDIDDPGLCALAQQLPCFPGLRTLQLSGCTRIGFQGIAALAEHLPEGLQELFLGRTAIGDEAVARLAEGLLRLRQLRLLDLRGCSGINASGLTSVTQCLPHMPLEDELLPNPECEVCHTFQASWMGVQSPGITCYRCAELVPPNEECHVCFGCDTTCCGLCRYGALWVPQHLEDTPEGKALLEVWAAGPRDVDLVRWC